MRAKVTVTEENRSRCRCARVCLTYADNELMGAVYCSNGNSVDAPQMQGCKCPLCLVSAEYHLKNTYYCRTAAHQSSRVVKRP